MNQILIKKKNLGYQGDLLVHFVEASWNQGIIYFSSVLSLEEFAKGCWEDALLKKKIGDWILELAWALKKLESKNFQKAICKLAGQELFTTYGPKEMEGFMMPRCVLKNKWFKELFFYVRGRLSWSRYVKNTIQNRILCSTFLFSLSLSLSLGWGRSMGLWTSVQPKTDKR